MSLYRRGKVFWMTFTDPSGARIQKSTGQTDESLARIVYATAQHRSKCGKAGVVVGEQPPTALPLSIPLDRWCESRAARGRCPRHIAMTRSIIESAAKRMNWETLRHVTPASVEGYLTIIGADVAGRTVNAHRSAIGSFCEYACGMLWMQANPCRAVAPVRVDPSKRSGLSADHAAKLCAVPWRGDLYAAMILTGLRRGEAEKVLARDDMGDHVLIRREIAKSRKEQSVPVGPSLRAVLSRIPRTGERLLPDLPSAGQLRRDMTDLGIPFDGTTDIHTLRHTCATLLHESGADVVTASRVMRHTLGSLTADLYMKVPMDKLIEAQERVATLIHAPQKDQPVRGV